jgi:hypothetical protein
MAEIPLDVMLVSKTKLVSDYIECVNELSYKLERQLRVHFEEPIMTSFDRDHIKCKVDHDGNGVLCVAPLPFSPHYGFICGHDTHLLSIWNNNYEHVRNVYTARRKAQPSDCSAWLRHITRVEQLNKDFVICQSSKQMWFMNITTNKLWHTMDTYASFKILNSTNIVFTSSTIDFCRITIHARRKQGIDVEIVKSKKLQGANSFEAVSPEHFAVLAPSVGGPKIMLYTIKDLKLKREIDLGKNFTRYIGGSLRMLSYKHNLIASATSKMTSVVDMSTGKTLYEIERKASDYKLKDYCLTSIGGYLLLKCGRHIVGLDQITGKKIFEKFIPDLISFTVLENSIAVIHGDVYFGKLSIYPLQITVGYSNYQRFLFENKSYYDISIV